jgi:hypothetical protein
MRLSFSVEQWAGPLFGPNFVESLGQNSEIGEQTCPFHEIWILIYESQSISLSLQPSLSRGVSFFFFF